MKKILITFVIILAIFLAIPLIGNKVIDSTLENRIELLTSYGLKVKDTKTDFGYLSTKKYFIFQVQDSKKFISYLNQFSDTQLPPYVDALVGGAEVGLDVEYSNIPVEDKVSIDIYPNALPTEVAQEIKAEDATFYKYVDALLKAKVLTYHLNYDVLNDGFDGYIKDINESYTLKDGGELSLKLKDATFKGKGLVIAPDTLSSNIRKFKLSVQTVTDVMKIEIVDFTSSSVFESKTTYATTGKFAGIKWNVKNSQETDVDLDVKNLAFDFSSNTQSVKADFYSKISFDAMSIQTDATQINAIKLNQDIALRNVSRESYEKLVRLIGTAKLQQTTELEKQIERAGYEVLSRGMVLDIADFSIQELTTAKTKNLGGMSVKSKLTFKQDRNLVKKINENPMALMKTVDLNLLFKMSKEMYTKLSYVSPVLNMAQAFSKEEKGLVIFDIKLQDAKLNVNGMEIN